MEFTSNDDFFSYKIDDIINSASKDGDVNKFLSEISEVYSDSPFMGFKYENVQKKTSTKLLEWKIKNIDLAHYINKPSYENGESELMFTFRWNRGLNIMIPWFMMLVKFGGNPYQKNKKGDDAFDIALVKFKEEGLEEEFGDFMEDTEKVIKNRSF